MTTRYWTRLAAGAVLACLAAAPATARAAEAEPQDANEAYAAVEKAYMNSEWTEFRDADKKASRLGTKLTAQQRQDMVYMRKTAAEFRPAWWAACRSTSKASIRSTIWGRGIICNYVPSDKADLDINVNSGRVQIIVNWNPSLVDNTSPEKGALAARHGLRVGDLGELVVWRQLGFNYTTASIPVPQLISLFKNNQLLYHHLQSFYADATSLYHCSPKARRAGLLWHGSTLLNPPSGTSEVAMRSSRAISAMFAAIVLEDPKKWPSVHLPPKAPTADIEWKVAGYLFNNVDPKWTLDEDRTFREAIKDFFRSNADKAFRNRGMITLPNKQPFMLMEPDDRTYQEKRDQWVKEKLEAALAG